MPDEPPGCPQTEREASLMAEIAAEKRENAKLRGEIGCAVNALTDSILCSGNDPATNMHFVRKLKALILPRR